MTYSAGWGTVGDLNGDGVGGVPEDRNINSYVNYVLNAYDAAGDSEAKLNIIVITMLQAKLETLRYSTVRGYN